jgi:hypothetical protein
MVLLLARVQKPTSQTKRVPNLFITFAYQSFGCFFQRMQVPIKQKDSMSNSQMETFRAILMHLNCNNITFFDPIYSFNDNLGILVV